MFPGRQSPVFPNSSGGKGHHSYGHSGHGHSGHGHRRDPKRESLSKSQSNPSLPVPVPPQAQATPPSSATFFPAFGGTSITQQQQQHAFPTPPIPANVGNSAPSMYQQARTVSVSDSGTGSGLWGEVDGHESGRPSVAHKQPIRPLWHEGWKASSVTCSVPKLYQPQPSSSTARSTAGESTMSVSTTLDHPRDSQGHNLVLHCIDLQQHTQELRHMISVVPSRQELRPGSDPLMTAPPVPSTFWRPESKKQPVDLLRPPPRSFQGVGSCRRTLLRENGHHKLPPVQLDQTALYLLLRKSVAAICAHGGYESSSSQALVSLADVLGDFLSRLCQLLRINTDQQTERGTTSFQDVLEQSLHQCGIRGKAALQRYWQSRVKGYTSRLGQLAAEQKEEYQRLTEPPDGNTSSTKSSVSTPSSLTFLKSTPSKDTVDFRLPSPWSMTPDFGDEEISLEAVMQNANLDNVLPTRTPDLGGPVMFSQFTESSSQGEEGFTALGIDGPPRKRLRTMSLSTDHD